MLTVLSSPRQKSLRSPASSIQDIFLNHSRNNSIDEIQISKNSRPQSSLSVVNNSSPRLVLPQKTAQIKNPRLQKVYLSNSNNTSVNQYSHISPLRETLGRGV